MLLTLDDSVLSLVLALLGLREVPSVALASAGLAQAVREASSFWDEAAIVAMPSAVTTFARGGRASKRLRVDSFEVCKRAFASRLARSDALHLALIKMCQESAPAPLSLARFRRCVSRWEPVNLSPTSAWLGTSVLLEVVLARGVYEAAVLGVVRELLVRHGVCADTANSEGMTPLCVCAARGLPLVLQCLVDNGAKALTRAGKASFMVHEPSPGAPKTVGGRFTPMGWVDHLLGQKRKGLGPAYVRRLEACKNVLQQASRQASREASGPAPGQASGQSVS